MPAAAHGARLGELYRIHRSMALALGIAAVVGFTTCLYFVLSLCYMNTARAILALGTLSLAVVPAAWRTTG